MHYDYWKSGIPSISYTNGITATFDISSIASYDNKTAYGNHNFTQYALDALNLWSTGNRKFLLTNSVDTNNKIYFSPDDPHNPDGTPKYGQTEPYVLKSDSFQLVYCEITIYYGTIAKYFPADKIDEVWVNILVHELGHALGLENMDIYQNMTPVVPNSVMSYHRDRQSLSVPHNCDIAGVKKNYMD